MNVTTVPVTLNVATQHQLTFGRGGLRIENNSRYTVYVAVGAYVAPDDIKRQAIIVLFPYQSRARRVNRSAVISIVALNQPYAINGTINGTADQVVISEDVTTSPFESEIAQDGLIGDYLIIAGGRIIATQDGLYARDLSGNEVLAVNLAYSWPWDGRALEPGDVLIGRGAQSLFWDNSAGRLTVNGDINVTGGSGAYPLYTSVTFTVTGPGNLSWTAGQVGMSDGSLISINAGSFTGAIAPQWLAIRRAGGDLVITDAPDEIAADGNIAVALFEPGTVAGSIFVFLSGTLISGDRIITGSITTTNLSATAIDGMTITGATIRTNAAAVPDVQMTAAGIEVLSDDAARVAWVDADGDNVGHLAGDVSIVGSGTNIIRLLVNWLKTRARGVLYLYAKSSSDNYGGLAADFGGSSDFVEVSHRRSTRDLFIRLRESWIEFCAGLTGSAIDGVVIGGTGGSAPGAMLDVRGSIKTNSRVVSPVYYDADSHAGITGTVTLAKLTAGGVNGSLSFSGGILIAKIDPT